MAEGIENFKGWKRKKRNRKLVWLLKLYEKTEYFVPEIEMSALKNECFKLKRMNLKKVCTKAFLSWQKLTSSIKALNIRQWFCIYVNMDLSVQSCRKITVDGGSSTLISLLVLDKVAKFMKFHAMFKILKI